MIVFVGYLQIMNSNWALSWKRSLCLKLLLCYEGASMENKLFDMIVSQVTLTRLTPIDKTWLFLKLTQFDKNRLVTFHLVGNKESVFTSEKHTNSLFYFYCYQLTVVANWWLLTCNKSVAMFMMLGPKPILEKDLKIIGSEFSWAVCKLKCNPKLNSPTFNLTL